MYACENTTQLHQSTTANEAVLLHQNNVLFQENCKHFQNEQVFIKNGRKWFAENEQLIDTFGEMQVHMAELENKFKASAVNFAFLGISSDPYVQPEDGLTGKGRNM